MLEDEQQQQQQQSVASRADVDDGPSMACVVCKATMGSDSIMLDKCMHVFCRKCLAAPVTDVCKQWRSSDDPPGCVRRPDGFICLRYLPQLRVLFCVLACCSLSASNR